MMLNMDLIDSSSESDDAETLDSLSDFGDSQTGDDDDEQASSSSELSSTDSGQCSDVDDCVVGGENEDEYERIFNRGLSTSTNSDNDEIGKSTVLRFI